MDRCKAQLHTYQFDSYILTIICESKSSKFNICKAIKIDGFMGLGYSLFVISEECI